MKPIIVLGSGLAGYTLVRELRKLDRDIPITMVSKDTGNYYSKPTLSNAFAQGKEPANLVLTSGPSMAEQLGITLLPHTEVRAIHRFEKQLDTSSGVLDYDRLVLASGADPIRIPLQGDAADAVLSVNDLEDYAIFRDALGTAKSIAIMGGGLIGCEFANDLAVAGYKVTVIDPGPYPLSGLMPEQAGRQLLEPLSQTGVMWRLGTAVHSVNSSGTGYSLTLTDETEVYADVVLSAVGLRPRIGLARDAGLVVNRGIVVDEQLRSSDEAIFALGDCAEIDGRVLPYVLPIMQAGRILAKVLNGEDARVVFQFMPVVVKIPAHPVVVSPVARDAAGSWQVLERGQGIKMGFFNAEDDMTGFVITGEYAGERTAMTARCVSKPEPGL
jgi:rubredoxin-NAD+ reductase